MKQKFAFWFHVFIVVLSWFGPFLFNWKVLVPVYLIIFFQFIVFGKCLLNKEHGLLVTKDDDMTFYAQLMEMVGLKPDRRKVKQFIHRYFYFILSGITLFWQIGLGYKSLIF